MSTLARTIFAFTLTCHAASLNAQIVTDGSLGPARIVSGPNFTIPDTLGTQLGPNLFHSFGDFNINAGESATFSSGFPGITNNVISRVTGENPSTINGVLRSSIPGADLWLLNPNGILMGPGAVLDLPGSFHATTAHYLGLPDGGRFGADITDPANSMLTVSSPVTFGFLADSVGAITADGVALAVAPGASVSLVGGEILLQGTGVNVPRGQLSLLSAQGTGEFPTQDNTADVSIPANLGAITLLGSKIDTSGVAGKIRIHGGSVLLDGGSTVVAEANAQGGGDILLAIDTLFVLNGSEIRTSTTGTGEAGNIDVQGSGSTGDVITAASLVNIDGSGTVDGELVFSVIESKSRGFGADAGAAGDVSVTAERVVLNGADGFLITTFDGAGGALNMNVDELTVAGFSFNSTATFGSGDAGPISIRGYSSPAAQLITVADSGSAISSEANGATTGGVGNIDINATELRVQDGGKIAATNVDGHGGDITLKVDDIRIEGSFSSIKTTTVGGGDAGAITIFGSSTPASNSVVINDFLSGIFSDSDIFSGTGAAGTVTVLADTLSIDAPSGGVTATTNSGEGGSITLNLNQLNISEGLVAATTFGSGNAGDVTIRGILSSDALTVPAASVTLVGPNSQINSDSLGAGASSGSAGDVTVTALTMRLDEGARTAATTTAGAGGTITLNVDELQVGQPDEELSFNFSTISVSTLGTGDAGSITVQGSASANGTPVPSNSIILSSPIGGLSSTSFSTEPNAGAAGNIEVRADSLQVQNIAEIGAKTSAGHGGTITLNIDELLVSDVGTIIANSFGTGDAGNIVIRGSQSTASATTPAAMIRVAAADIATESDGSGIDAGSAGNIIMTAETLQVEEFGVISVQTDDGPGGDITLNINQLLVSDGNISAATFGRGDAGSITIRGNASTDAAPVPAAQITISGFLADVESLSLALGDNAGDAGSIRVVADELLIDQGGQLSVETTAGRGGDMSINAGRLSINGGATISASTDGTGDAGDIFVDDTGFQNALLIGTGGIISSLSSASGAGGSISLDIQDIQLTAGTTVSVQALTNGTAGSIILNGDTLQMSGSSIEARAENSAGGSIAISMNRQVYLIDSAIQASAQGVSADDTGGNVGITGSEFVILNRSIISANANAGAGGNIFMATGTLVQSVDSSITATSASNVDGLVEIDFINDLNSQIVDVQTPTLDLPGPLSQRCTASEVENRSTLIVEKVPAGAVQPVYLSGEMPVAENLAVVQACSPPVEQPSS